MQSEIKLRNELNQSNARCDSLLCENARLIHIADLSKDCLEFYADDSNWKNEFDVYSERTFVHINNDVGNKAKQCLKNTQ